VGDSPQTGPMVSGRGAVGALYAIHASFLAAIVVYFILTLVLKIGEPGRPLPLGGMPLTAVFGAASLVCMIGGFAFGWFRDPAGGVAPGRERVRRVTTQLIVADAFFEAPAVLGLILFALGYPLKQAHLLIFASLLVVALQTLHLGKFAEAIRGDGGGDDPNFRGSGAV